jgi:hypothetical protein
LLTSRLFSGILVLLWLVSAALFRAIAQQARRAAASDWQRAG